MTEETQSLNVHVSQQISIPLKDYVDQRFRESDRAADFRLKFAEEILQRVEKRGESEYAKFEGLMPRDTFNAYTARVTNEFNGIREDLKGVDDKINANYDTLRTEISKLELRIVGKEIFAAYVQRTTDEIGKAKEDTIEAASLAAEVREHATGALSAAIIEQNKTNNSRFEDVTKMIIAAKEETTNMIITSQKRPWHLYLMGIGVAMGILGALGTGFDLFVLSPMQTSGDSMASRIEKLERSDHDAIQNLIKTEQSLIERLPVPPKSNLSR